MKKFLIILSILFIATPAFAQVRVPVTCSGTWVNNGDGTQSCNTSTTAGTGAGTAAQGGTTGGTGAQNTSAPCTNCNLGYTPLEPIPGVSQSSSNYDPTNPDNLHNIINAIFTILITGGALMAVLSLTIGGIQYMTSGGPAGKNSGIKRAQAAMWAMLLIAGTWLILHTVNPALLQFRLTPCQPNSTGCTVVGSNPNVNNVSSSNTATAGTAANPYTGTTVPNALNSTNTGDKNGCNNAGGTWTYNYSLGLFGTSGGTCAITPI